MEPEEDRFGYCASDLAHHRIIESVAQLSSCRTYLELGVEHGVTLSAMARLVDRAIGVDIVDRRTHEGGEFHLMSTDEFFEQFHDTADIVFIDADHRYGSVVQDFESSLNVLSRHGVIFLHDTDPISNDYLADGFCGDAYKVVDYIKDRHPELDAVTLPVTTAGLTIVTRRGDRRIYDYL